MNTSASPLALLGGTPVIDAPLAPFRSVGEEEAQAAAQVVRGGVLSAYIGAAGEAFMGGPAVRAFEAKAAAYFGAKHAVAVNSWTSGLIAAVAALGLEPGDEVITTPWTMAATATAILHNNAIPIFADIDPQTFNIDPAAVERLVTPRTRAILAADIFGLSADMRALRVIADRHGLKLLTDTAQSPGARYGSGFAGLFADIGGFSLNYHKHIHCGEGGILVTDDDRLAARLAMIRNHAEAVTTAQEPSELAGMLGYNFRLGEIEAAIASIQLDRLKERVASRQRVAAQLNAGLAGLPGLRTPQVTAGSTHVYYVYGMVLDTQQLGLSRDGLLAALRAEGVPGLMNGYQNIHLLPVFRRKIAHGTTGFPWTANPQGDAITYAPGLCPVAEELHARSFLGLALCLCEYEPQDVGRVIEAFRKVWGQLDALRA
jgi:dTDP-4-amino-4,6-dideoxygalactose transaminase